MYKYNNGSEWRRWDLHIHTKGTNKNDQFSSSTFDIFCIILFRKAIEHKIAAIGITDYFSVENYKKVKCFITDGQLDSTIEFTDEEKEYIKGIYITECRIKNVTYYRSF